MVVEYWRRNRMYKEFDEVLQLYTKGSIQIEGDKQMVTLKGPKEDYLPRQVTIIYDYFPFTMPTIFIPSNPQKYSPSGVIHKDDNNLYDFTGIKLVNYTTTIKHCELTNLTKLIIKYSPYVGCLYCENVFKNDWSPIRKMTYILEYIKSINRLKRRVKYESCIDLLQLPEDITFYIMSFLM